MSFYADDLATARDRYTDPLGMEPYYAFPKSSAVPAYIKFGLGADLDKLGFTDRRFEPSDASNPPGGAVMFWHVDDLTATAERLLAMGTSEYEPRTARKADFATAAVVDPFNVLGVMQNAHLLHVLAARAHA